MIKADNRIVIGNAFSDKVRNSQLRLALDIAYPRPRYKDYRYKQIIKLPIGRLINFLPNDFEKDITIYRTFTLYCPCYLMKREEISNNDLSKIGIIDLMETMGFILHKASFLKRKNDRGNLNQLTLSFEDKKRGPAKDWPGVVKMSKMSLNRCNEVVYNEFLRVKDEFKHLSKARYTRYRNKRRTFTEEKKPIDEKEEARQILGITNPDPTKREVLKAYRRKARENHPDKGGDKEKMQTINRAKLILLPKIKLKF
jgi:hypothetical protein